MSARIAILLAVPVLFVFSVVLGEPATIQSTLIPKGSETAGKTLFVEKGCYRCHVADDITTPASSLEETLIIDLGGTDHAGWSRDDFARAIMDPHHTVSDEYRRIMMSLGDNLKAENSPMPGFNDLLTVSDLIHLSTFLETLPE